MNAKTFMHQQVMNGAIKRGVSFSVAENAANDAVEAYSENLFGTDTVSIFIENQIKLAVKVAGKKRKIKW
tara:strand:+ start:4170 stop:4379 length:210 start_codon:yes stop_codon:yes gene_type:complete